MTGSYYLNDIVEHGISLTDLTGQRPIGAWYPLGVAWQTSQYVRPRFDIPKRGPRSAWNGDNNTNTSHVASDTDELVYDVGAKEVVGVAPLQVDIDDTPAFVASLVIEVAGARFAAP